ncbi:hypothetical protein [Alteribacter natronophilus]|uniref:hypothetical protein n=1 Tax=Alteribacter natronophilus TaxID=2583810 RepID=UPI001486CA81|nr:hypothetical protein [Alteribacter natronophilus]
MPAFKTDEGHVLPKGENGAEWGYITKKERSVLEQGRSFSIGSKKGETDLASS